MSFVKNMKKNYKIFVSYCWCCYCCWSWCWETCYWQFGADLEAEGWSYSYFFSDFEHKVWSRFQSWSSGEILKLKFGQYFAADVWLRLQSWILVKILNLGLMLNRDSKIDVWSRFVWNLWYELNPRVRCAFGNVLIPSHDNQGESFFWSRPEIITDNHCRRSKDIPKIRRLCKPAPFSTPLLRPLIDT